MSVTVSNNVSDSLFAPNATTSRVRASYGPGPRIPWTMQQLARLNGNEVRIVALMSSNPKSSGAAFALWQYYLGEPTLVEFGINTRPHFDKNKIVADLRYNLERGFIKLVDRNGDDITP